MKALYIAVVPYVSALSHYPDQIKEMAEKTEMQELKIDLRSILIPAHDVEIFADREEAKRWGEARHEKLAQRAHDPNDVIIEVMNASVLPHKFDPDDLEDCRKNFSVVVTRHFIEEIEVEVEVDGDTIEYEVEDLVYQNSLDGKYDNEFADYPDETEFKISNVREI